VLLFAAFVAVVVSALVEIPRRVITAGDRRSAPGRAA